MSNMNDQLQAEGNAFISFMKRPVPLWAAVVAFLLGLVVGHL